MVTDTDCFTLVLLSAEISISIMQWRRIRIDLHYLLLFVEINYFPLFKMFRIGKGPEQLTDTAWNNNVSGLQWRVSYRLRHSSQQSAQQPGTRCVPCVQFSTYETSRYTAVYSEHIGYLHFNFRLSWATTTHCTHGALKPSPMTGFKIFTGFHYVRVEEQPRIRKSTKVSPYCPKCVVCTYDAVHWLPLLLFWTIQPS